jgi:hypothetical protein
MRHESFVLRPTRISSLGYILGFFFSLFEFINELPDGKHNLLQTATLKIIRSAFHVKLQNHHTQFLLFIPSAYHHVNIA